MRYLAKETPLSDYYHKGKLTNLLELLFLTVFAFPNASSRGFDSRMTSLTLATLPLPPETLAI